PSPRASSSSLFPYTTLFRSRLFGAEVLFENIQMEIDSQSRIALVGRNGAGKSTLIKIIAGIEQPDQGQIVRNKNIQLGYLAQNTDRKSTRLNSSHVSISYPV